MNTRLERAHRLVRAALAAVDPYDGTLHALRAAERDGFSVRDATVFAFGKAARGMARAAADCGSSTGIVVALDDAPLPPFTVYRGEHPLPAADAAKHAAAMLERAATLTTADVALCLVSGGGSAMLELPAGNLDIADLQATTHTLLRAGLAIEELNAVRRCLSRVKGGRLAAAIAPATILNVLLSDVPGAPPEVIASGPTMPMPTRVDVRAMLVARGVFDALPANVRDAIVAADAEPPPPPAPRARTYLAGDNQTARAAIIDEGKKLGLRLEDAAGFVRGEAREAGAAFYREARNRCTRAGLDGLVWGGETTVTVRGHGKGGRNQEFVLGAFGAFEGGLLLSVGTDGVDGSSGAAGAWLDEDIVHTASRDKLSVTEYLAANDANGFFERAGGRLVIGPTGTNVADVCIYLH